MLVMEGGPFSLNGCVCISGLITPKKAKYFYNAACSVQDCYVFLDSGVDQFDGTYAGIKSKNCNMQKQKYSTNRLID